MSNIKKESNNIGSKSFNKKFLVVGLLVFIAFLFSDFAGKSVLQKQKKVNTVSVKSIIINKESQKNKEILNREELSLNKPVSEYVFKKCATIEHTDGEKFVFCIADFKGTTNGFYDIDKKILAVDSFDQYVLIHEIFHAASMHYYKKGYTDIGKPEAQEKMAYDAENILLQINKLKNTF